MPFGLTNAPAVFQAFVNDVLRDCLNQFLFVYLDDILTFSPDEKSHVQHVHLVLKKLLENQLLSKQKSVNFIRTLSPSWDSSLLPTRSGWIQLRSVPLPIGPLLPIIKKYSSFLISTSFLLLIRNVSSIAAPLHALTSTNVQFVWNPQTEQAFQRLKEMFTSAPILTVLDPHGQFVVEVDASNNGIGAILCQGQQTTPMHIPVA